MNVLFLTLRTFKDTGGIQKVCRSICKTLADLDGSLLNLKVLSLHDSNSDLNESYIPHNLYRGFSNHRWLFISRVIKCSLRTHILLLSHINLLPVAMLIKIFRPRIKIVLLCHGVEIWKELPFIKRRILQQYVDVWCVSKYTAAQVIKQHQIMPSRVHLLANGLDPFFVVPEVLLKPSHLLQKYGISDKSKILFCLTRMSDNDHEKGYTQLFHVLPALLAEYPDVHYLLAGHANVSESTRIQKLIQQYQLESHVKLLGYLAEKELVNHYLLADLFVLASNKEGFGLVLIEAAACGCPIVCGKNDGSSEAVLNGKLATMIDAESKSELLDAIRNLLAKPRNQLKSKMQQAHCLKHFSYQCYRENVKRLLTLDQ